MKRRSMTIAVALAAALLAGCDGPDDDTPKVDAPVTAAALAS